MYTQKNDEAVSPVIGVILMVAITVILAAVIAAFVFGMAGSVSKTKTVAITAKLSGTNVVLTNMGGQDVGSLDSLTVTGDATGTLGVSVGNTNTLPISGNKRVLVTGVFKDGSSQVLLDTIL
jgi:flagellin-like protein